MRIRNVLIAAWLLGSVSSASANTAVTFPSGSLIIPTSSAFQDDCGAVSAYGVVYDVLRANAWLAANNYHVITIYFVYSDTKASPNRCVPTSADPAPTTIAVGVTPNWYDGCDLTNVSAQLITNSNLTTAATSVTTYLTTGKTNVYPNFSSRVVSSGLNYMGGVFVISAGVSGAGGTDVDVFRQLLAGKKTDGTTFQALDASSKAIDFTAFRTRNATQNIWPGTSGNVNSQCSLGVDHYVNVHIATTGFPASVGKAFQTTPPRLALLASAKTTTHTGTVDDGILEKYLKNAGLDFAGAGGCATSTVNTAICAGHCSTATTTSCLVSTDCPSPQTCVGAGTASTGQIYDSFDFDDITTTKLTSTKYTMLWTPHWETAATSQETTIAFPAITAFLNGQTGLAAECASISSFEGSSFTGGASNSEGTISGSMQLQTCAGTTTCTGTTPQGVAGNPVAPYGTPTQTSHALFQNCSDPGLATSTGCIYFSYPGDSFAQIADYKWDASGGWVTGYIPRTAASSIYTKSVVPLMSIATLTSTNKSTLQAVPGAYNSTTFTRSTTDLAARALTGTNALVADLATRSVKDATAGKANVLYLGGHDQSSGVGGTKVMLETLLQLGISNLPPTTNTIEVSRNSPIVAQVSSSAAVVQGTYELVTPAPSYASYAAGGSTFKFPAIKGHLRARTTAAISAATTGTTGSLFGSSGVLFDAATVLASMTVNPAGCAHFTSACRTVFTTLASGAAPTVHYLTTAEVGAGSVGEAMGTNTSGTVDLSTTDQATLISRVLAGDDSALAGQFKPALGGVDRSTVAVIGTSAVVNSTRQTIAYFGADDGMLHAVCASTGGNCATLGQELWAYIPHTELGMLRDHTARIDGSPRVFDAFINNGTGQRAWRTVLVFQTGTGDISLQSRVPAVYALDVSDPTAPTVLWEYEMAAIGTSRGNFELGQGLTIAAGQVQTGTTPKYEVYAQTNNFGTLGDSGISGNVVTAINVDTGVKEWQNGYKFATTLRTSPAGSSIPPATGMPGGAVGVDKTQQGYITDLIYATLYGDLWEVDPTTGLSRYSPGTLPAAGNPLFRFSTDMHPIGGSPAVYSVNGGATTMYAAFATGGYTDSYPNDTSWTTSTTQQYALGVNLSPTSVPGPLPTFNENAGTNGSTNSDIPIKFPLTLGEASYAEVSVISGQLFVTSDTGDVNNSLTYGTTGQTGHVYAALTTSATGLAAGPAVVIQGGASSVVSSGTTVFSGASSEQQQLQTAASGTAQAVETTLAAKMTRRLWLRTQ